VPDDLVPPDSSPDESDEAEPAESTATLTTLDVSEIIRDSVAQASQAWPAVLVEVSTPPRFPAVGEAAALRGVLRMLVDNACRQSDAGVTVKAKRGDEGITVHVIDRGPGMDRDHTPEGFDAAKTLIALHGGILWAEPLPAGGTKVGFTIPEEPPTGEDFDAKAAVEAIRLLDRLAAPPVPVDIPDADERQADAQIDEPIDLTALAEQAAAEASDHADHPPVPVVDAPEELHEPEVVDTPAPSEPWGEAADPTAEPIEELEPPVQLEDVWVEPAPEEDEPTEEVIPEPLESLPAAEPEPESQPEPEPGPAEELQPVLDAAVAAPVDAQVEVEASLQVKPDFEPPIETPIAAEVPAAEVATEIEAPPMDPASDVGPAEQVEPTPRVETPAAVEPPRRFVLDPLHPATQMLRGLALDYDPDADRAPLSVRRPRTS
jgi:hypothetical protein